MWCHVHSWQLQFRPDTAHLFPCSHHPKPAATSVAKESRRNYLPGTKSPAQLLFTPSHHFKVCVTPAHFFGLSQIPHSLGLFCPLCTTGRGCCHTSAWSLAFWRQESEKWYQWPSDIDPVLWKRKDSSKESKQYKGKLRPLSEPPESWITATEGELSCGLIHQSIQSLSLIDQWDLNENQMLLEINQKAVLTIVTLCPQEVRKRV